MQGENYIIYITWAFFAARIRAGARLFVKPIHKTKGGSGDGDCENPPVFSSTALPISDLHSPHPTPLS